MEPPKNHSVLQKAREKHKLTAGAYISDIVYGANDGIITTFAIVAASAGAEIPAVIIVLLGIANLVADGFSMATSNYLGMKSQYDFEDEQRRLEEYEIEHWPEEEKMELREIYERKGLRGPDLERTVAVIAQNKQVWVHEMMVGELGILPEEERGSPLKHALATFIAFVTMGAMPLVPFLLGVFDVVSFQLSILFTAVTLFIVGGLRTRITKAGFLKSALQMVLVGGLAAALAYGIGAVVQQITGYSL